ncbi:MAG: type IV pilus assembly protein PilM [Candidatus Eiseniibacteriota bacterium]|nr:MAG: type IV pilus assembly protein PilM [Candidatus Eisenbacteria bacterium]
MLGKKKSALGLDIGSSSVKIVELEETPQGPALTNYGVGDLLPEAIVDGEIMDRQSVVDSIRNLIESTGIKDKRVVTAVSGRAVIVKKILMDRLGEDDAREAVQWEAEQHVPYDVSDVVLDFQILKTDVGPKQMQVLLVAAKKEMINVHADLVKEAGLVPELIDVDAFAVQNAMEANYDFTPEDVVTFINIGGERTNVSIVKDGAPHFTKDLALGGNTVAEALQREHALSHDEAVKVLRGEVEDTYDIPQFVQVACDDLVITLDRALAYLQTSSEAEGLTRILLSGGGSRMRGVKELLAERFNVPTDIANPLLRVTYEPALFEGSDASAVAPTLAVAIGLALRKVGI